MRCMAAGQYELCRVVSNLANLLRANVANRGQQKITPEEELRYVRCYLELQKERYGAKLRYEIELESQNLLGYYLPKLTIQPLVENSVVHGLENKRGGGSVHISIWEEDGIDIRGWETVWGLTPRTSFRRMWMKWTTSTTMWRFPMSAGAFSFCTGRRMGSALPAPPKTGPSLW